MTDTETPLPDYDKGVFGFDRHVASIEENSARPIKRQHCRNVSPTIEDCSVNRPRGTKTPQPTLVAINGRAADVNPLCAGSSPVEGANLKPNCMIVGFEEITEPLTDYEQTVLLPVFVRCLSTKIGKQNAITNAKMVAAMRACEAPKFKIDEIRVRKIINHIRDYALVPCLIATSKGYYVATTDFELQEYEESLKGRIDAINQILESIHLQRKQKFHHHVEQPLFR